MLLRKYVLISFRALNDRSPVAVVTGNVAKIYRKLIFRISSRVNRSNIAFKVVVGAAICLPSTWFCLPSTTLIPFQEHNNF